MGPVNQIKYVKKDRMNYLIDKWYPVLYPEEYRKLVIREKYKQGLISKKEAFIEIL